MPVPPRAETACGIRVAFPSKPEGLELADEFSWIEDGDLPHWGDLDRLRADEFALKGRLDLSGARDRGTPRPLPLMGQRPSDPPWTVRKSSGSARCQCRDSSCQVRLAAA